MEHNGSLGPSFPPQALQGFLGEVQTQMTRHIISKEYLKKWRDIICTWEKYSIKKIENESMTLGILLEPLNLSLTKA